MSQGRLSFMLVLCLAVIGGLTTLCSAQAMQAEHHSFKVGGWELNALTDSSDNLMGFWGIPRSPLSVGNIRRLWFEALPNDEWSVYAYEPVNANTKAAELYASGMSEQSLLFFYSRERKAIASQPDQDIDGGVEGLVEKGFIAGDPLTETVGAMDDPTPMIDLLGDVSYSVAPGMSEMLVEGTAGVNVNMNQATKQLLNCLRSSMSSNCGECVCVEYEGMIERGPWTVTQTDVPQSDQIRCDYSRVVTHTFYQYGEYPDDCTDCTIGSADDPATWTEVEEYTDFWLDMTECPAEPIWPR